MHTPITTFSDANIAENLLLADPSLRDGYFDRSVIYMVDHSIDQGSLGLILNKPTPRTVGDLISSEQFKKLAHLPIHMGGPVDNDQMFFANFECIEPNQLSCEFRLSAERATELIGKPNAHIRAFVGHSAWTVGQLEEEFERHAWFLRNAPARLTLESNNEIIWQELLQDLSPFHHIISLTPKDPFLN
ncbi:YqgE/AlgH family protein [Rubritalea spongiae]|uniref:YqgE/AlgH family protein n=1 Tax=Rubritalea spongiae TaxID=430797 RepID=A0ABW5E8F1_9BACT